LAVPSTRDEIAALGATMNGLLDRLHAALERERRFVGDASKLGAVRPRAGLIRAPRAEAAPRPAAQPRATIR
jgi:hypothetical protein